MPRRTKNPLLLLAGMAAVAALALTGCAAGTASDAPFAAAAGSGEDAAAAGDIVSVASLSPASGSLSGGTTVTVAGQGYEAGAAVASVSFGTEPVASFAVLDDSTLTAVTPAALDFAVGSVPVTVTLADGSQVTSPASAQYAYEIVTPVDSEMSYAFTYWKDYNLDAWSVFSDNDCGNFVNQAMVARGWEQTADWYSDYATTGDYSLSWIRGNEMDDYYASRPDTNRLTLEQRDQVKIGDVVMFDWDPANDNGVDHTMIVSKVTKNADGTISIGLVGHTVDAQYRDLDTAITVENPGGTAHFWSIA